MAINAALHAIRGGLDIPLAEGLAREAELFGQLCATPEKQAEAVALRFTAAEIEALRRAAGEKPVGTYCRELVLRHLARARRR